MCTFVIILACFFCAINIVVDPFVVWNVWNNKSVNAFKSEQATHERLYKAIEIINLKPSILFIGTSRTRYSLDPGYYSQTHHETIYNAAVTSANMNEMLLYFKHAVQNQPELKQVIVGIDFYAFNGNQPNKADFPRNQMEKVHMTFESFLVTTASLGALKSSMLTVINNIERPTFNAIEANGKSSELQLQSNYGKITDIKEFNSVNQLNINSKDSYAMYELSQQSIDDFQELVDICREKNIDLKVFISPSHATEMEAVRVSGNWQEFENMKRILSAITPIWDFSGYNSVTTEPISAERQYYWDSSHYKNAVGNMILDKINGSKGNAPNDFGVMITPENIENHLISIQQGREKWANNNLAIVNYVQSLKE